MSLELSAEQLLENWNKLIGYIPQYFEGERKEKLTKMYEHFQDRMMYAPASGREHYHNAFPGGYVMHIINVTESCLKIAKVWEEMGATPDWTEENIVFCAMHHDLGKVGDMEQDYYVPNPSEWHRINQGKIYDFNKNLNYMTVTDRACYLLMKFGVDMTEQEYLALRLTDGLYEEGNTSYLKSFMPEYGLKSNLPHILHQGDMLSTKVENEMWKRSVAGKPTKPIGVKKKKTDIKSVAKNANGSDLEDLFGDLFKDKK